MKIGIDISQIVFEGTGVGRFTHDLTETILTHDSDNEWTFFFSSLRQNINPHIKSLVKKKGYRLLEYKVPPTALSFLWNTLHRMKVEKVVANLDWFITSDWTEGPSNMKKATIIHDLVYVRYPETVHNNILQTQKKRMHWVQKESKIIFADSTTTKEDAISLLNIDRNKIFVNYPGVHIAKPSLADITKTLAKFNLKNKFILSVGKIEPRKNIKRLIEAFITLNKKSVDLVIVGHQGWDTQTSKKKSQTGNIKFLNFVSNTELSSLYASCLLFVYPSLYEGFGYPIVEAMSLGAPVATSNTSSMKEIAENRSVLFDPMDISSISQSMNRIIEDGDLKNKCIKTGIMRSRDFSWKSYYQNMIKTLKNN